MPPTPRRVGLFRAGIQAGLLLLALAAHVTEAAEPKRILVVHSYGRDTRPYHAINSLFRTEMLQMWEGRTAFYEFALESGRPSIDRNESVMVEHLRSRFADATLDLVVTIGPPAARFYVEHRAQLFGAVPLLMLALDEQLAPVRQLAKGDAVVGVRTLPAQMLNNIVTLLPETTTVAVIFGDSPSERFWVEQLRKAVVPFEQRLKFEWLNKMTLWEMRDRVATLGPGTVVLYGLFLTDAGAVPYEEDYALKMLHAASSAPVFGFFGADMGLGIVGGALLSEIEVARAGARAGTRILHKDAADGIAPLFIPPTRSTFDWRELDRWHVDEKRLPAGAEVLFRPPTLWAEHKGTVVASILVVLVQAALIVALVMQLLSRRRAEHESFRLSWRLLTAHEDERRRLARELHDDVTQRLASLAIDAARMESLVPRGTTGRSVQSELVRLSDDVHSLSYRLHPSILDDLGLAEALRAECEQITRHHALQVDVAVDRAIDVVPNEVALCLFRVAQEALRNVQRHARATLATVRLAPDDGGLTLGVSDNGTGFDVYAARSRASLGCASMGERVRLLGGRLGIESALGEGTTITAWVPLVTQTA